jgi:hypothetical protein
MQIVSVSHAEDPSLAPALADREVEGECGACQERGGAE